MEVIGRGVPAAAFEARADEPDAAVAVARGIDAHAVDAAGAERLECRVLPDRRFEQQPLRAAVGIKRGAVRDGRGAAPLDAAPHRAADRLEKERGVAIEKGVERGKIRLRRVDVRAPDKGRKRGEKARLAAERLLFRRRSIAVEHAVERSRASGCQIRRALPLRQLKKTEHEVVFR